MKSNAATRCGESRIAKRVEAEGVQRRRWTSSYILGMNKGARRKAREGKAELRKQGIGLRDDN